MSRIVLVVAKAPVAGAAKTRLIGAVTPTEAADLAAAALLDTLHCSLAVPRTRVMVALTGDLRQARCGAELLTALRECVVVLQRGTGFADRLVAAHTDAGAAGVPVLQIGMDTPQVTPSLLEAAFDLLTVSDAVLGRAEDGGWWALGLNDPADAAALVSVPMSTRHTGDDTLAALGARGVRVAALPVLRDVDTWQDAVRVASTVPGSRFATALDRVSAPAESGVA